MSPFSFTLFHAQPLSTNLRNTILQPLFYVEPHSFLEKLHIRVSIAPICSRMLSHSVKLLLSPLQFLAIAFDA
jgi:hypothetical protein